MPVLASEGEHSATLKFRDLLDRVFPFFTLFHFPFHTVTCSSAMFKSLIDVITFINETQVFMYDKSNFITNPQYIYKYIHSKHVE